MASPQGPFIKPDRDRILPHSPGVFLNIPSHSNLRVANFIEEGRLGGPQLRITQVAKALSGSIETIVILPGIDSARFQELLDDSRIAYRVVRISRLSRGVLPLIKYVLTLPLEIARLRSTLHSEPFDVVHISGGAWQIKGVIAAKLAGRTVVWHLNDTKVPRLVRLVFRLLSRLADGFIFASERSRVYYQHLLPSNRPCFVIPAPVDTRRFSPSRMTPEHAFSKWPGKIVIGTVGNVNPIKGIDVMIQTAARLNQHRSDLVFVVAGNVFENQKPYFHRLQQLARELGVRNIEFVGNVEDVRPLLARIDIYLCASYAESSPLSVWEAMSMGKAVVSTDVGDVPLYAADGKCGSICPVAAPDCLARRILDLVEDEPRRRAFGHNARTVAAQQLDLSRCAAGHQRMYETLVQQGGK